MEGKNETRKLLTTATATLFLISALFGITTYAKADNPLDQRHEYRDSRYHHDRFYPKRDQIVRRLPPKYEKIVYKNTRYYFHDGIWYRPSGSRFFIVAPPLGLFVHSLPPYYTTIWIGGVPYYYANEVYYTHYGNGYQVVAPPEENTVNQAPPPASQLFIYPRNGQNEKQQADDRYQCHTWAVAQTGYDPTQLQAGSSAEQKKDMHADYLRAMSACLDGRGYTVK